MKGKVQVTLKGATPLIMNRFPKEPMRDLEKKSPEEQAEIAAYRDPDTHGLYIPAAAVKRGLMTTSKFVKDDNNRTDLPKGAIENLRISPERIPLDVDTYKIFEVTVRLKGVEGMRTRFRPYIDDGWSISFEIEYEKKIMSARDIDGMLAEMGVFVGLLELRPEKRGDFGKFYPTECKEIQG